MSIDAASIRKMVFWPAVVTLAITLLRLTGELLHWSPALFNRDAGGGGALVGSRGFPRVRHPLRDPARARGQGPRSGGRGDRDGRAGPGGGASAIMVGASALRIMKQNEFSVLALAIFTSAIAIGAAIAWSGWPALGRTLLAYAFAARIPVALV